MRKLASVQQIEALFPIEGADAIEVAKVLGWNVVVKKGEFQVGDHVVYCEVDSLLPERESFEFLRPSCFKSAIVEGGVELQHAGFRIKTVKLRGQVSQGICFPISILPDGVHGAVGDDVTDALEIVKYEPPVPTALAGRVKGPFPGFVSKTDEIRVQVLEETLERHRGKTFYVTEKVDGSSFTAFLWNDDFGVCSRNLWLDEADQSNALCRMARQLELEAKLRDVKSQQGFHAAIQGELIGPGVQGNKYRLPQLELRVFNVVHLDEGKLLEHESMLQLVESLGLANVPQLGTMELDHTVDELVALSQAKSQLADVQREGIVMRPLAEEYDPDVGGRLSFKVINPKFLLKYDD